MKFSIATAVLSAAVLANASPYNDCRPSTVTSYCTETQTQYKTSTLVNYNTQYSTKTVTSSYTAPAVSITATVSATVTVVSTSQLPPKTETCTVTSTVQQPPKTVTATCTETVTATPNSYPSGGNQCNAIACCDNNTGKCTQTNKACAANQQTMCCSCSSSVSHGDHPRLHETDSVQGGLININAACCNNIASFDQVSALLGAAGALGIHL